MAADDIAEDIKIFIAKYIRSVGHLEVLLLLAKYPNDVWNAEQVFQELRTNPSHAQNQLDELTHFGLLKKDSGGYLYHPEEKNREIITRLYHEYTFRRATVITLIYSHPMDKIRGLADAFKIKKE